jgi:D-beta-D-heptose 7-phosphate kinase/D-beta-D-heptose 1-phosphate adenosyltransferase
MSSAPYPGSPPLTSRFRGLRVAVFGDFCLDRYVRTSVVGMSPEFPVPRVLEQDSTDTPGAAGNLAVNFFLLGAEVHTFGVAGPDPDFPALKAALAGMATEGLIPVEGGKTTVLARYVVGEPGSPGHHLLRVDRHAPFRMSPAERELLLDRFAAKAAGCDVVFFSDYDETGHGERFVSPELIAGVRARLGAHRPILAGSSRRWASEMAGLDLLFLNRHEAGSLAGDPEFLDVEGQPVPAALQRLRTRLQVGAVVVTCGASGAYVVNADRVEHHPSWPVTVVDVCGAGDSFAAAYALAAAAGGSVQEALRLGTLAGASAVTRPGTAPVSPADLDAVERTVRRDQEGRAPGKLRTLPELLERVPSAQRGTPGAPRVVFTNGCYDLLHAGHIHFLRQARALGDVLVVALNSDASVTHTKGPGRPLISELDRADIMAALEFVDHVVIFDDLTPLRLIEQVRPDVLVKGGGMALGDIVGADVVQSYGGIVHVLAPLAHQSTTALFRQMQGASDGKVPR